MLSLEIIKKQTTKTDHLTSLRHYGFTTSNLSSISERHAE